MSGRPCIVAGIDLGQETERVVSYAALFARARHATVRLLYVIDYLLTPPVYLAEYVEDEKRREQAEMEAWKARLQKVGIEAEYGLVLGRLHESFVKVIEDAGPALLVIGYSSHVFRPSSSERLIRSLKSQMLVVRGEAADGAAIGSARVKKILCPVDFSENSKKAAVAAKEYASLLSASLHLMHVVPSYTIKEKRLLWKWVRKEDMKKFDAGVREEAKSRLGSFSSDMNIEEEGEICEGRPGETISSIAREGRHDLIVMGARGLSYIESVLIGSTTDAVLKSSPCPVLIIH
jgi:nucleotide-binding universal stress UspA family protein